ncbi:hypothetical protein FOMPIDRAFT_1125320 [Fomitopsis schrenkii]|uniref:Cyclin N-terminal domain-containing protein n=1 Tax=Fomitopsis schrenkii TaxID=2126942 RepID=S8FKW3_FOMSC|nr:hypothetical protein FOMPIDRAFT_1125320 [Fomitopsis schrenkii]
MALPVHKASLVDPSLHNPALLQLIKLDLSRNFIAEHIVDTIVETVDYALGRPSSSSRGRSLSRHSEHAKFTNFVTDVIHKAEIKVPALLVTLAYIDRAKPHLQIALEQWACERVFLGALIVANKYTNDSTLKNVHWALCTGIFGKRDIGRIEREFLDVLDFELGVSEQDVLAHHAAIMALVQPSHHHIRSRASLSPSRAQPSSRWSSDSDSTDVDMDQDSDASTSSGTLASPRTPADVHAYPPAPVPAPLKHAHSLGSAPAVAPAPHFVLLPSPTPAHVAAQPPSYDMDLDWRPQTRAVQQEYALRAQQQRAQSDSSALQQRVSGHTRMSSALQLLHSFPIPHFGAHSRPPTASQPRPRQASGACRPQSHAIAQPTASYALA